MTQSDHIIERARERIGHEAKIDVKEGPARTVDSFEEDWAAIDRGDARGRRPDAAGESPTVRADCSAEHHGNGSQPRRGTSQDQSTPSASVSRRVNQAAESFGMRR